MTDTEIATEEVTTTEQPVPEQDVTATEPEAPDLTFDFDPFADDEEDVVLEDAAQEPGTEPTQPEATPAEGEPLEPATSQSEQETPEPEAQEAESKVEEAPEASETEVQSQPEAAISAAEFIDQNYDAIVTELASRIQVPEENLHEHLPKVLAKGQADMMKLVQSQLAASIPGLVELAIKGREQSVSFEDKFYGAWPELKGLGNEGESKILAIGKALKAATPDLKGDEFIRQVGMAASISLGKQVKMNEAALNGTQVVSQAAPAVASATEPGVRIVKQEHFSPAQDGGGGGSPSDSGQLDWLAATDAALQSTEDDEL